MSEVTSEIDITLDSEILAIEKVVAKINEKQGTAQPLEGFASEIRGRFEEIGFVVDVRVYTLQDKHTLREVEGTFGFVINIKERTEAKAFDHDRMVSEVTSDILGLGEGGFIKSNTGLHVPSGGHKHKH